VGWLSKDAPSVVMVVDEFERLKALKERTQSPKKKGKT